MLTSRWVRLAFTAVALLTVAVLYFIFDPAESAWAPKCAFRSLTGWECPGCGAQRMLHHLLHGEFAAAWEANPFLICMIPVLCAMVLAAAERTRWPRFYMYMNSLPVIIGVCVLLVGWSVLRNIIF